LAEKVVGIGRRPQSLRIARRVGAVDVTTTHLPRGVQGAELIVVCTPVGRIAQDVLAAAAVCERTALLTDAGSTKAQLVAELDGALDDAVRFVGSHPLAGSERSGPSQARADLFAGRVVVVTPTPRTAPRDVKAIGAFWTALGARVVQMSPQAHDRALAFTSHLPHLVASALAGGLPGEYARFAASGFRDITRVASSDPELWRQIFVSNRREVLRSLESFRTTFDALEAALRSGDDARLLELLTQARRNRDALGT
jgi:prephenate dehydrogenase